MNQKGISFFVLAIGMLLVVGSFFLMTATSVKAQCGSQASSCKNCHETQAQLPVNNDGKPWHTQHAFGDFCYLCHAGNNQATDKAAAHTGMVAPLSDINTSCKGCHPTDVTAKAQIYATILGQQIGTGSSPTATTQPASSSPASTEVATAMAVPVPAADMVDYSQRYDEVALGKSPVNVGNIILIAILAVVVLGGGFFILKREGLINISFDDPKKVPVTAKYPADVVDLLPTISKMKPGSRKILHKILTKPQAAAELLTSIEKLTEMEPKEAQAPEDQTE